MLAGLCNAGKQYVTPQWERLMLLGTCLLGNTISLFCEDKLTSSLLLVSLILMLMHLLIVCGSLIFVNSILTLKVTMLNRF